MPTYTAHSPPPKAGETQIAPERFVFVRDGFHVWAFLLTPFWLLWRRLWLAFALYLLASVVLAVGLRLIGADSIVQFVAGFLVSLLIGFEASSLLRRKLAWKRWSMLGFVIGEGIEMAEHRFFAEWAKETNKGAGKATPVSPAAPQPNPIMPMRQDASPAIIGLFPEAERPR
jgi:Protein of unknown function (DUF2628)